MISQILAVIIFLAMFILIITEVWERHIVTLGCALLTLVVIFGICMRSPSAIIDTLNLKTFFTEAFWHTTGQASESSGGINWETIVFIAGMMIMVEGMAKSGFFRWLCMKIAKMVKYQIIPIFITFMVLSFVLAMFIDSITVILFLAAVTVELSQLLKFNPVPMILSEIFCANLGGSATMCGDPPNIIIGTSLGMSFSDFVTNTGLIAIVSLVAVVIYFYLVFRKELTSNTVTKNPADYPDPSEAITSKGGFVISWIIDVYKRQYLAGPYVRDKDAVIGSMLICEMAAYYRSIGSSLKQRLEEIYAEYGRYLNKVDSFEFPGLSGMDTMAGIMQKLRQDPPAEIAGYKVVSVADYEKPEETGLPAANVLIYKLENNETVIVRPSGTEPKIKIYYTTLGKDLEEAQAEKDKLAKALEPILA